MSIYISGGPDRIYDKDAAAQPLPPKHPLGFTVQSVALVAPEKAMPECRIEIEPLLWEGQD